MCRISSRCYCCCCCCSCCKDCKKREEKKRREERRGFGDDVGYGLLWVWGIFVQEVKAISIMLLRIYARSGGGGAGGGGGGGGKGSGVGGGRWRSLSTVLMYPQQTADIADMSSSMSTPQPANPAPPAAANPVPPPPLSLQGVILYPILLSSDESPICISEMICCRCVWKRKLRV